MAINDTENPEEGTPRSKKDIRKERRQMRAVNRERKSMGGEPLYVEKDFQELDKPYQGGPGKVVAGTPVIEDDTPDVEYIKYEPGGYTSKIKPLTKEEFISQKDAQLPKIEKGQRGNEFLFGRNYDDYLKELGKKNIAPETTTTMQFKAGTPEAEAVMELAKGETTEKSAIIEALRKEANQRPDRTFTSSVEENKNINAIGNVVNEKINEANQEIVNTSEQVKQQQAQENLPGSGASVISKLDEIGPGITWDQTYKSEGLIPESREDIFNRAAASARKQAPQLAIEKLGVQDYYPDISRNIAVGTFTGSRIGSRTIYSGAGGLLPLGLYDARKRAIAAEIKRKEALMDELKSVPDIAKQFKPMWTSYVFDKWSDYLEAYKNNPEGLASDIGFAKINAQLKAVAENFKDVDVYMDDFKKKLMDSNGNAAAWATPRMLQVAKKFNSGYTPEKIEEFFSGKKNIAELKQTVEAIPNGYNHIDKRLNDLLKDSNKVKRAITPKDGVEWTPALQNKINDLSQQVSDGSIDYERYLSIMKEYFDIDFSPMINEWVDANNLGALTPEEIKAYKQSLQIYAEAQIPAASFIPTIVTQNNNSASRYAADQRLKGLRETLQMKKDQFNYMMNTNPAMLYYQTAMKKGSFSTPSPASKAYQVSAKDVKVPATFYENGKLVTKEIRADIVKANPKTYFKSIKTVNGKQVYEKYDIPDKFYYNQNEVSIEKQADGKVISYSSGTGFTQDIVSGGAGTKVTKNIPLEINFKLDKGIEIGDKNGYNTAGGVSFDLLEGVGPDKYMRKESFSEGSFEYGPAED